MPEADRGVNSTGESFGISGLLPRPRDIPPALVQNWTENLLPVIYQPRAIPKDVSDEEKHTQYFKGISYIKLTADEEKATVQFLH